MFREPVEMNGVELLYLKHSGAFRCSLKSTWKNENESMEQSSLDEQTKQMERLRWQWELHDGRVIYKQSWVITENKIVE